MVKQESVGQLLATLHQLGVAFWVDNGKLYSRAPESGIPGELRGKIAARKAEIIAYLQDRGADRPSAGEPELLPKPRDQLRPLSFAQQRLWFLDQLEGAANPTYIIPAAYRLSGMVQAGALEQALNAIVQRHETLRTAFPAVAGKPSQLIHDRLPLSLNRVDLSRDNRQASLQQCLAAEAMHAFDLARGSLFRATLYTLGEREHVLLLTLHHIIADAWSLEVMLRELDRFYTAFVQGVPAGMPELSVQYADFALWQREWLQGERLDAQTAYWKKQLADAPAYLELPADTPRPAVQRFHGGVERFDLEDTLAARLRALARRHQATLFMTLLAAFAVQLSRYSGQDDIIVGTPVANRNRPELEDLIGFFVNTLALRIKLRDAAGVPIGFSALLERIRRTTLDAFAHQDLPFEQLVQALGIARNTSHTPLVQAIFALENRQGLPGSIGDMAIEALPLDNPIAKFELALVIAETPEGLSGGFEYNSDVFEPETVRAMAGHFKTLLAGIVEQPETSVFRLPLLSARERHTILVEWNDTAAVYPDIPAFHQWVERRAHANPDAAAVIFAGAPAEGGVRRDGIVEQLSYRELNARANQLARHLEALGAGPGTIVGLCVRRSTAMIVGLLGILKAGAAYLPLDPAYPPERLAFMLGDAAATILITQSALAGHLPVKDRHVVRIDTDWPAIAQAGTGNLNKLVKGDDIAYVIYTSGSTGIPKGVLVEHGGLGNLARAQAAVFRLTEHDKVLQMASLSFDAATAEIVMALSAGSALYLTDRDTLMSGAATLEFLALHGISTATLTPSVLAALPQARLPALHTLMTAGEACSTELTARWARGRRFLNLYGPTEATVWSTVMSLTADMTKTPIGKPIPNTLIYILDAELQPVPVGVVGEIYIGGAGVARGYLNRPELTRERFVRNPFRDDPRARLYKTGDLGRWLPEGVIEFRGRADGQVKLRGFRIEPGEIENVLLRHPGIGEAVVTLCEENPGRKRLVAYVVAKHPPADIAGLKAALRDKLPDYMVPSAIVSLEALPLTPNGKVDRKALPAPGVASSEECVSAPRTPVEEVLAAIWAEVLDVARVGVTDNFFDLGGHSLLVTQVTARIRSALQADLPVRALFESPTIAQLAAAVEREGPGRRLPPPIRHADRDKPLPLSFAQQRLWFLEQLEGPSPAYNIPVALRLSGPLAVDGLQRAVDAMVSRHESLRTTFPGHRADESEAVQTIHARMAIPLEILDCRHLDLADTGQSRALNSLLTQAADRVFDLSEGPLLRINLYRLGEEDHVLLVTLHHIIADGWSVDLWWQELGALYQAAVEERPSELPPLPIHYADYVVWQRDWLARPEVRAEHLDYWRQGLAGAPPLLELPTDHLRPPAQTFNGRTEYFTVEPELVAGLLHLGRQADASLFMTMLAAFSILLARYSGQDDIVIGIPIANRQQQNTEGLIGLFVNSLPVRLSLSGAPNFLRLLARTRQMTLDAQAHQDMPFEQLVAELDLPRSLSYAPVFQVMVAHHKARSSGGRLGNLPCRPLELENTAAKFDLTLYLSEPAGSASDAAAMRAALEYNTDLFSMETAGRIIGHFRELLRSILAHPESDIHKLEYLTAAEIEQLRAWNRSGREYPSVPSIHALVEAQAERTPHAVALAFDESAGGEPGLVMTYAELNRRANQLAHYLRGAGMGRGSLVGICLPQSEQLIIGILAVLKAGAAYVPLDPLLPPARLEQMLGKGLLALTLTRRALRDRIPESQACLCLDAEPSASAIAACDTGNPGIRVGAEDLAYMIYTSGSTGVPKGAGVYHRGFVNLLQWFVREFSLNRTDRVLITSSSSFDLTQKNFFAPLMVGGQLHLSAAAPYEYASLRRHIARHGITWLNCAPSAFYPFVEEELPGTGAPAFHDLRSLRLLVLGGEPIALERLKPWLQSPDCRVVLANTYGPTECSDVVSFHTLAQNEADRSRDMPLGRAISNVELHVLDQNQLAVPVGVAGELCIGGLCVGAGYLNDPALTSAQFIKARVPGAGEALTVYRTGDRVLRRTDGLLVFLGRMDYQVKVRGFRVELGDVEIALRAAPGVREAVVMPHRQEEQTTHLIAYLTLADGSTECPENSLRGHLETCLPDYMIPSAFVVLAEFPTTASGKIDRKRLPEFSPEPCRGQGRERMYEAPQTADEECLAGIWQDLLKRARCGRHDNFFALGGHSLAAVRLVTRILKQTGIEVPVRKVFEAPTIARLAALIADARMENRAASSTARIPCLERGSGPLDFPLSFAQQRLWFLDRLENSGAAYRIHAAYRIEGDLCVPALEWAIAELAARHEVFRTTFPDIDGRPIQRIHPRSAVPLTQVDLRDLADSERASALRRLLAEESSTPFALDSGPLLRTTLYRLREYEAILMVSMHHIISDDWSMEIWWRDLDALYRAFIRGKPVHLSPLPVQYADFAVWQRDHLAAAVFERQLEFWKSHLAGAPELLELPLDRPRPAHQTYRGGLVHFSLDADLAEQLTLLFRDAEATPFMGFYAAFAVLLSRYARQDDLVIGSPITHRRQAELEPLIGFFVNTLPLRADLSGNPSFHALLGRVRKTVVAAFGHSDLPFERMVSSLAVARNLSHAPLFQALFVWHDAQVFPCILGDLKVQALDLDHASAKFDLTLYLAEPSGDEKSIAGVFEYNSDLFDRATIERMARNFSTLLHSIAAAPDRPVNHLPWMPAAELDQVLHGWNRGARAATDRRCLHHLFEAQAERTPDAPALTFDGDGNTGLSALSYRELNRRANRLAHYLRDQGVGPGAVVGIGAERSFSQMIGILGILKAGAAYLPVDMAYPAARIAHMLENGGVSLMLTQTHLLDKLPAGSARRICLDTLDPVLEQGYAQAGHFADPGIDMDQENLLYVLYTSGSTGRPKGVAMPHRPLCNLVRWQSRQGGRNPLRTLQYSPISFDVSCQEMFATWCEGGTLVLVSEATRRDPYALLGHLAEQRIERLFLPFVALQQLAEAAGHRPDLLLALREVIAAGEQLQITGAIAGWFGRLGARLHNHYGPSETHVITAYTLPEPVEEWPRLPPIGRPLDNCAVYLLDPYRQPVPVGVVGEIYLGGAGVCRGYLNQPELTRERFVDNPWGQGVLYRSGDLGRYRGDGEIEYLGRADDQVKVRGYRIEPGEIETALTRHPTVREALVLTPPDQHGHRQLVAYVIPAEDAAAADLRPVWRKHLLETLPAYMVPGHFVEMKAFPLTPSGKVDRRRLLAQSLVPAGAPDTGAAPRSHTEKAIAAVWCELLGVAEVGVNDNFFDVGGHSLLVVQMHDKLQKVLNRSLSITDLFQYPNIAALADYLSGSQADRPRHAENQARAQARRRSLQNARRAPNNGQGPDFA